MGQGLNEHVNDLDGGAPQGLVGRDQDVEDVWGFLNSAEPARAVLLSGEPGVGKTALMDQVAQRAAAAGARVLRVTGAQFESGVPYAGLNQILLPLYEGGELETLTLAHREALDVALGFGTGAPPEPFVLCVATSVLLRRVAATTPLLLGVDDLPWMDQASVAVLGFVACRLQGSGITFLATAREGSRSLFNDAAVRDHDVSPLDEMSARLLLRSRHPRLSGRLVERVITAAQGNPLALLELPTALSGPRRAALESVPAELPLSRRLQRVFGSQAAALPPASRRLLLVAALEGTGDLAVLQSAARESGAGADLSDLGPAESDGLVSIDEIDYRLRFRHPLIRSAVLETSTLAERRAAHRVLAGVLHEQPDRRAFHLGEASVEPDEDVACLLERSGRRLLQRGDAVAAIRALTRAANLSPGPAGRAARLAEAAYVGADATRELDRASHLLEGARQAGSDARGSLYSASVEVHQIVNGKGDIDTAHQMLVGAIENGGVALDADDPALEGALALLLQLCWMGGRPELWDPFYKILDRLRPEVPQLLAVAVAAQADPARTASTAPQALEALVSGLAQQADPSRIARIAAACIYTDRLADVREDLWRTLRQARDVGQAGIELAALSILCMDAFLTGRWNTANDLGDEGLRLCEEFECRSMAPFFQGQMAMLAAARGETSSAEQTADAISGWGTAHGALLAAVEAERVRALCRLGEGDFESAYRHAAAISPPGQLSSHTPNAMWVVMDLVEAAVRTNRQSQAEAHVRAVQEAGIAAVSPRLALLAGASAALAATADDEAVTLFEQALALQGIQQWPFEAARVTLVYGERLRKARAYAEARTPLSEALRVFEELGARPWAERARRELKATGWGVRRRSGPASVQLTPQEAQIAQLAASGLTNKQIAERLYLSPRTVGGHLSKVFPKLAITSRAALRDALTKLDEQPG